MSIIINLGSENKGGTFKQALKNANRWLSIIRKEYPEVTMSLDERRLPDGDWLFEFKHGVTNKCVALEIHGFNGRKSDIEFAIGQAIKESLLLFNVIYLNPDGTVAQYDNY